MIDLDKFERLVTLVGPVSAVWLLLVLLGAYFYRRDFRMKIDRLEGAHGRRDKREDMLMEILRENAQMFTQAVTAQAASCAEQAAALRALGDGQERLADALREGQERVADALRDFGRDQRR